MRVGATEGIGAIELDDFLDVDDGAATVLRLVMVEQDTGGVFVFSRVQIIKSTGL